MDHQNTEKLKHRQHALAVLLLGICLTLFLSYLVSSIQGKRFEDYQNDRLNGYYGHFKKTYEAKAEILKGISDLIVVDSNISSDQVVTQTMNEALPLIAVEGQDNRFKFVSLVSKDFNPVDIPNEQIVTADFSHAYQTRRFILNDLKRWQEIKETGIQEKAVAIGFDYDETREKAYMVLATPFYERDFEQFQPDAIDGTVAGFALAWLDLSNILRESWNGFRNPERVLYLKAYRDKGQDIYLLYQSGIVQRITSVEYKEAKTKSYNMFMSIPDVRVEMRLLPINAQEFTIFSKLYIFVLLLGLASSLFYSGYVFKRKTRHYEIDQKQREYRRKRQITPVLDSVIRTNEARWHYIADNLPVALFAVNSEGYFTLGEGRGLSAFGLSTGDIEGNTIFEVFEFYPKVLSSIQDALEGNERQGIYEINRHWLSMRFSPVTISNGMLDGVICVGMDVSEEHMVRERLNRANMHLQGLMANVPTGVAFIRDGVIQWCSRWLEDLFNYPENSLQGRSPEILYNDSKAFLEIGQDARPRLHENDVVEYQAIFRKKNGERFKGQLNGRCVDPNSFTAGTMWVIRDMTNLIEQARQRRLNKAIYDNLEEGVMVTDAERKIVFANNAFKRITGYSAGEVMGKSPSILSSGIHETKFYDAMWSAIDTQDSWSGEIWNRNKSGDLYLSWLTIQALRGADGQFEEYVAVFHDITGKENKMLPETFDQLTGLPNKLLLERYFNELKGNAIRQETDFSLVYVDLDNLSHFPDQSIVNIIIKTASERFKNSLPAKAHLLKMERGDFVILLDGISNEKAISRYLAEVSMMLSAPIDMEGQTDPIMISASFGIASCPKQGGTLQDVLRKAQHAMESARGIAFGMFMFYDDSMEGQSEGRISRETRLMQAINNEELHLYYQPVFDCTTKALKETEVLLRWNHPEEGILLPKDFFYIAEENGLSVNIGEWVIGQVFAQMEYWLGQGLPVMPLSINLSLKQIENPQFANVVLSQMIEMKIPSHLIKFELSEYCLAECSSSGLENLKQLKAKGIDVAIDDFGINYSLLNLYDRLEIDQVKIDQYYIQQLTLSDSDQVQKQIKSMITVANSLNIETVALGVENEKQQDFVCCHNCKFIQGFINGPALDKDTYVQTYLVP